MSSETRDWTERRSRAAWLACAWAYGSAVAAAVLAERIHPWAAFPFAVWFIGARQHTLYVLNHDASHGNLFRSRSMNRWFGEIFCHWPFFSHPEAFSYVLWRRVHILHHARLFSESDPNFVGRRKQGDTESAPRRSALCARVLAAPFEAAANFFRGRQDYVSPRPGAGWDGESRSNQALLWRAVKGDPELEWERRRKLLVYPVVVAALAYTGWLGLAVKYWIVPMYTAYPCILKLMDLTEHNWYARTGRLEDQTNSRAPRLFARLLVSDLGRELHWEHHLNPLVPFHRLRAFSRELRRNEPGSPPLLAGFLTIRRL